MKRRIVIGLVLALMLVLLAACGSDDESTPRTDLTVGTTFAQTVAASATNNYQFAGTTNVTYSISITDTSAADAFSALEFTASNPLQGAYACASFGSNSMFCSFTASSATSTFEIANKTAADITFNLLVEVSQ